MLNKDSIIAIVGQGYVGLPLSVICSKYFSKVIGVDLNVDKIEALKKSVSYVEDVSSEDVGKALRSGFEPSSDFKKIEGASIVVLCVPTPLDKLGNPDFDPLMSASKAIAQFVSEGTLIISQSTSHPTTVREIIAPTIERESGKSKLQFAVSPERVDPGNSFWNYANTPRIVGARDENALTKAKEFYTFFCNEVVCVSSMEVAEMAKILENSYRLVNISLVNQFAELARKIEIDIFEVIEAAATKPYGFAKFYPGIGAGGHCIPVDPIYGTNFAKSVGVELSIIDESIKVNRETMNNLFNKVMQEFPKESTRILICGISYKYGIADTRESSAVKLMKLLRENYSDVLWWDGAVREFEDELPCSLEQSRDLTIITQEMNDHALDLVLKNSSKVIDCTGRLQKVRNVMSW